MENIFIILFIVIANIVALLLTYHSFGKNIDNQKKMLYTMLGFGTMYIIILIIYWLSSIGIENKAASQSSKDMITFTFVPVNTIILLPILIRAYSKVKNKQMDIQTLNKKHIIGLIISTIIVTSIFYYILMWLDTPNIIFSTLSIVTSFVAASLTMLRSSYYAMGYAANDIVLIVLWVLASLENPAYIPVVVNFAIFLLNDMYGFVSWKKRELEHALIQ